MCPRARQGEWGRLRLRHPWQCPSRSIPRQGSPPGTVQGPDPAVPRGAPPVVLTGPEPVVPGGGPPPTRGMQGGKGRRR